MNKQKFISVVLDDEALVLRAVIKLQENNELILDVLSPFPVHGLDEALKIKRSRIPVAGFISGALGAVLFFVFQAWVFTVSYPLIIGGKPFFAAPAFIPITFEATVLFAGIAMVIAFFVRSKLKPDINFESVNERITDDLFVILVDAENERTNSERLGSLLSDIKTINIG